MNMSAQNLYVDLLNKRMVYLLERTDTHYITLVPVDTVHLADASTLPVTIKAFENNYQPYISNRAETSALLDYFNEVYKIYKIREELRVQIEYVYSITEKHPILMGNKYNQPLVGREYHYNNRIYTKKGDIAKALGMSAATLNIYIEKNGYNPNYLTEQECQTIAAQFNTRQSANLTYTYNGYQTTNLGRFLSRIGTTQPIYKKWCESGHDKTELTNIQGVQDLLHFTQAYRTKKHK